MELPINRFQRVVKGKWSGHAPRCRQCHNLKTFACKGIEVPKDYKYRPKDSVTQEEFRVRDGKRTCYICKTHKPLSEYYKNKGQCKACFQIKNSARRKTPEARRQRAIKEAANKAANPCLRIAHTIRTRLGALAKRGFAKPGRSQEIMGCTWSEA